MIDNVNIINKLKFVEKRYSRHLKFRNLVVSVDSIHFFYCFTGNKFRKFKWCFKAQLNTLFKLCEIGEGGREFKRPFGYMQQPGLAQKPQTCMTYKLLPCLLKYLFIRNKNHF